ncbi:MAG TPA: nuclear transport factor 2 family protein [Solirubrobacteraceae bacterium]|nr:nuclear transport factor 2 family protein [Solirubrobacteraceae bacterium]
MSAENVELIRSMLPRPDVDLAAIARDEEASARWKREVARAHDPRVRCTMQQPGQEPVSYDRGLDGLHAALRDWLRSWESLHLEIEDVIDGGDRVLVVHRSRGRLEGDGAEVARRRASVWTVREHRVVRVDFGVPYDEPLAAVGRGSTGSS